MKGGKAMRRKRGSVIALVLAVQALFWFAAVPPSRALVESNDGNVSFKGYVETNNLFRTKNFDEQPDWIQNRNTFQLEYRVNLGNRWFFDNVMLTGTSRAWADGAYSRLGKAEAPPNHDKEGIERESDLFREINLSGKAGNLWFKLGRQQIVWGKADFFRLTDIINPMDFSRHFFFEDFQDLRIPKWMGNFIYSLGNVGPLTDLNVEFVVNPGDFKPTNIGIFPMPWALAPPGFDTLSQDLPDRWNHSSFEFGERVEFSAAGIWWALSHFNGFQQSPVLDFQTFHLVYPRENTFGLAFDYANEPTGIVLRTEATYVPNKTMGIDSSRPQGLALLAKYPNGMPQKDEVKYVIGLDRPTWIKFLNPHQTFFLSAQVFMTHVLNHEDGIADDGAPIKSKDPVVTGVVNTQYLHGRLTPQVFAAYKIYGDGLIVGGSLDYQYSNHLGFKVGANSISGRPNSPYAGFGGFSDRDEFFARVRYSF